MFATGYWLLATGYWLLATGYWLLATGYWLLATGYWLLDYFESIHSWAGSLWKCQTRLGPAMTLK